MGRLTREALFRAILKRVFEEPYGPRLWPSKVGAAHKTAPMPSGDYLLDLCLLLTPQAGQLNLAYIGYIVKAQGGTKGVFDNLL